MISRSVITAALIGIVVTGLIPVVAGLVLLAVHKIKASSFWAGVLAFVIAIVTASVISGIISAAVMMSSMKNGTTDIMNAAIDENSTLTAALQILIGVVIALAMAICVGKCMKTRTFNAALSCGLGFGISYLVTAAMSFFSSYSTFSMINNGSFDSRYTDMVSNGFITKEAVNALKETFTAMTAGDILFSIVLSIAVALLMTAGTVFIMRGVCIKKAFAGIGISLVLFAAQFGIIGFVSNTAAASIVAAAIGAAALIFALRMGKDIVPPEKPSYANDSFMQSIENAKSETDGEQ
ncbi:MAG: hypothetical protein K2K34_08725 [Oscillospiraceae bacterium]|nr:hypothetical protein [Oscillospiraceae bacterium]